VQTAAEFKAEEEQGQPVSATGQIRAVSNGSTGNSVSGL